MSFERLAEICKERYTSNAYAGTRFEMTADLLNRIKEQFKPAWSVDDTDQELTELRLQLFGPSLLHELWGIPIVINAKIPVNTWQLIYRGYPVDFAFPCADVKGVDVIVEWGVIDG